MKHSEDDDISYAADTFGQYYLTREPLSRKATSRWSGLGGIKIDSLRLLEKKKKKLALTGTS